MIELPLPYVLSSAEGFATGAVHLLDSLNICTHLSFGSESGEVDALSFVAKSLLNPEIDDLIKKELSSGISYAAARQKSAALLIGNQAQLLRSPNNILGIEYIKALKTSDSAMEPITIKRKGTAHDGENITEEFASASMLRTMLNTGREPWGYMPSSACRILKAEITQGRGPINMASSELAMLAKLRTMEEKEYAELPDASEGLLHAPDAVCPKRAYYDRHYYQNQNKTLCHVPDQAYDSSVHIWAYQQRTAPWHHPISVSWLLTGEGSRYCGKSQTEQPFPSLQNPPPPKK